MSAFEDHSGKINSRLFREVLKPYGGRRRSEVITGPQFGVDTSVIQLKNDLGLAVSSDPVSLIPSLGLKESAWLSVHLTANDIATTGFAPCYVQFVLNLPVDLSLEQFEEYWKHIHTFCDETGIAITGGHTGQAPGQESTVPGGATMFVEAPADQIITSDGAEPGDIIIVTKESALVSSSILAMSFPETVSGELGEKIHRQGCENFWRTSVLPEALAAAECLAPRTELKAMHDVTEGGLLGGIAEMAEASGCGFTVGSDRLPVGEAPLGITQLFEIDHRFCAGAGAIIMAVCKGSEEKLIEHLRRQSISAVAVGKMEPAEEGHTLIEEGEKQSFDYDGEDPYWNAFFNAMEKGWK